MRNGCDSLDYNFYLSRSIDYRFFFTSSQSRSAAAAAISREARETEGLSLSKHQRLPLRHFIKPKIIFSLFTHSANNYMCCRGERKSLCAFESHIEPRYRLSSRSAKRNKKLHRTVSVQAERAAQALVSTKPQSQSPAEYHRLASQATTLLFHFVQIHIRYSMSECDANETKEASAHDETSETRKLTGNQPGGNFQQHEESEKKKEKKFNLSIAWRGGGRARRKSLCVSIPLLFIGLLQVFSIHEKKNNTATRLHKMPEETTKTARKISQFEHTAHTGRGDFFFCLLASASLI